MTLQAHPLRTSVAVSDPEAARTFYEDTVGLANASVDGDGSRVYHCGDGAALHVYPAATSAGTAAGTVGTWLVDDLAVVVAELTDRGLTFEQYHDGPLDTDARGIQVTPDGRVAWFRDPDGNTFAIEERAGAVRCPRFSDSRH